MKTEFESRISFRRVKLHSVKKPVYEATVFWHGQLYETIKATRELCVSDLMAKAGAAE